MNIVKASYVIESTPTVEDMKKLEKRGRVCYKSEDKITEESYVRFLSMIVKRGHFSVIEHEYASVTFTIDRGVSHEMVRHRLASFSQESTRYVNYAKGEYTDNIAFVDPLFFGHGSEKFKIWMSAMDEAERHYNWLIAEGARPEEARTVLPNSLKTEICVTTNLRHWREIFKQRCSKAAHPQMREVMQPLLAEFKQLIPIIFDDI